VKKLLVIGGVCFVLLVGCCGGFLYLGVRYGKQEAKREYEAAEELWSAGNKAEAVEKYRNIKKTWLGDAEKEVVEQRILEFDTEQANKGLAEGHKLWAAGQKTEAAAKYRALQLDLVEPAEQDTVKQRIREVDLAKAKKDSFLKFVPSGVATVAELQSKGFAYLKVG